jgi:Zn-dependent protease with chaperone function
MRGGIGKASFYARALVSAGLLVGFYVTAFALTGALFAFPVFWATIAPINLITVLVFAVGWLPAIALLKGALTVRPAPFRAPGRELGRDEAPELFALVEELARRTRTAPPSAVYLSRLPNMAVTEAEGKFGFRSRRVLILGVPLLEMLTVDELRAVIAHECGHFLGGDTRLAGVAAYTVATFQSVVRSGEREPFTAGSQHWIIEAGLSFAQAVTQGLVNLYARLFFRITRWMGRREELAADAWSASLAGAATAARALEKIGIDAPLYELYLRTDVSFAVSHGAIPVDLVDGFKAFRQHFGASEKGVGIIARLRTEKSDPFDSHPALAERLHALGSPSTEDPGSPSTPAHSLVRDPSALRAWLCDASVELFKAPAPCRPMPWAEIPAAAYEPALREAARKTAERLYPLYPDAATLPAMFVAVVRAFERGEMHAVAERLEPNLGQAPEQARAAIGPAIAVGALGTLFQGALLAEGGTVESVLGEPALVIRMGDERVAAAELAAASQARPDARAEVVRWADSFAGPARTAVAGG